MITLTGSIIRKQVARTSKSERMAICLSALGVAGTPNQDYILRRVGGHPFVDPTLHGLVGKRITADGEIKGKTFFMTSWVVH